MHRTNIYLPDKMREYLKRVAKEKGISMADVVRRIIDAKMEEDEDVGHE